MSNLPTLSDRAKPVHNSRKANFGYVANGNDEEERTARDEANDLEAIIAVLSSEEQDEQEPPRLLPPPEPPPLPPRRPWPGTNEKPEPTKYVNGSCQEVHAVKATAGGVLS